MRTCLWSTVRFGVAATLWCAGACDSQDLEPIPRLSTLPDSATIWSAGALDGDTSALTISRVLDASLSRSGAIVAIADEVDPFVTLVDRGTGTVTRVAPEGNGPGEIAGVWSIGFIDDATLFVLSPGQRFDRFRLDGGWGGGGRLDHFDLTISAARPGCGGRLVMLGLPSDHRSRRVNPWFHVGPIDATDEAPTEVLHLRGDGYQYFFGETRWDADESRVLYWQTTAGEGEERAFVVPCSRPSRDTLDMVSAPRSDSRSQGQALSLPEVITTGAVLTPSGVLSTHWQWRNASPATRLVSSRYETCSAIDLRGQWSVHDRVGDEVLMSVGSPVPRIYVARWTALEAILQPVACPAEVVHVVGPEDSVSPEGD